MKGKKSNRYLIEMLSCIFKYKLEEVGDFLSDGTYYLKFENRLLDEASEFCTELNVYIPDKERVLKTELYNNLLFGVKVSEYIGDEVLVNDESDDPYQWVLIKGKQLFLVEEVDDDNEGITLMSTKLELSYEKSIKILPGKNNIESTSNEHEVDRVYFVTPSSLWNTCLKNG